MDLWVRSQNKKFLVKANELSVQTMSDGEYIYNGNAPLGKYDTRKRCLEILDEIQTEIQKANSNILIWQNSKPLQENEMKEINEQLQKYNIISTPNDVKIEFVPKGSQVIIYQMPEK